MRRRISSNGWITSVSRSTGSGSRQITFDYISSGYVNSLTDNIGRSIAFELEI